MVKQIKPLKLSETHLTLGIGKQSNKLNLCFYIYFYLGSKHTAQLHRLNRFNMSHLMTTLRQVLYTEFQISEFQHYATDVNMSLPTKTNRKVGQMPAIVFPFLWFSPPAGSCQSHFSSVDLKLQEDVKTSDSSGNSQRMHGLDWHETKALNLITNIKSCSASSALSNEPNAWLDPTGKKVGRSECVQWHVSTSSDSDRLTLSD